MQRLFFQSKEFNVFFGFSFENKEKAIEEIKRIFSGFKEEIILDPLKQYDEIFLLDYPTLKGICDFNFEVLTLEEFHETTIPKKDEFIEWGD